jgi:hypothetical protein
MRRVLGLVLVVGLVLASAAPTGAAPMDDPIEAIECVTPGDFAEAKVWFSGKDDKVMHFRGLANAATEWRYVDDAWVMFGTNAIEVNYNGAWVAPIPENPEFRIPTVGTFWGTFALSLDEVGDFEGTWSVGKGTVDGRGSGSGAGQLIKVDLLGADPGWNGTTAQLTESCPVTHYVEYTVVSH